VGDNGKQNVILKEYDPQINQQSVVVTPDYETTPVHRFIWMLASAYDDTVPWSITPQARDKQLREFITVESMLGSTVYAVSARNANFAWEVIPDDPLGPSYKNTIQQITRVLQNSNRGKGWINLLLNTCVDFYSQDNGAFWELIRIRDEPTAPVINIAHLDAQQCTRTGDPRTPVIYQDKNGIFHALKYYEVQTLEDMPMPVEGGYGTQLCAVSRALMAARILRDIAVYEREKVSGQFNKEIAIVSGVAQQELQDAMALTHEQMLNAGLTRYAQSAIVSGIDPSHPVSVARIPLATLPDSFDKDSTMKWYIAQLAMAFGIDYQELAPLPGGNLGTSQQSMVLHMKTQGKGPALFMSLVENVLNNGILPKVVKFKFKEHDLKTEMDRADAAFTRSKDRSLRVKSGELDTKAAIDLAVQQGDLPAYMAKQMQERMAAVPSPDASEMNVSTDQVEGGMESQITR
jgi:hypothetical protein